MLIRLLVEIINYYRLRSYMIYLYDFFFVMMDGVFLLISLLVVIIFFWEKELCWLSCFVVLNVCISFEVIFL